jgi:adenine phosphoribosyltransferase
MTWGETFADEFYELKVAGLTRKLPKVKINDELAIASFVMFGDTKLIEACAEEIIFSEGFPSFDDIDILVSPEAKAIPFVHAIARKLEKDYVIARKSIKGYMSDPMIEKVQSITTIGAQTLVLDRSDVEKLEGKNVCIIDDVVSTGGSLIGLQAMLEKIDCKVICKAAVLLEEAGYDKDDLVYLEKLPIFTPSKT